MSEFTDRIDTLERDYKDLAYKTGTLEKTLLFFKNSPIVVGYESKKLELNDHLNVVELLASIKTNAGDITNNVTNIINVGNPGNHNHDEDTLKLDGVNSDGGEFPFDTTGKVSFNQEVEIAKDLIVPQIGKFGSLFINDTIDDIPDEAGIAIGYEAGFGGLIVAVDEDGDPGTLLFFAETVAFNAFTGGMAYFGGDVEIDGYLKIRTIAHETTDVDKFLVDSSDLVNYRTGGELRADIDLDPTDTPTFKDLLLTNFSGGNESISQILIDTVNAGVLDAITITEGVGLNVSWDEGEIWDHTGIAVVVTDENTGPVACTDDTKNYVYWDRSGAGTALTLSTTLPDFTDDDVGIAVIYALAGTIWDIDHVAINSLREETISNALALMFPSVVVNGLVVSEHAGVNAFDVDMTQGIYFLRGHDKHTVSAFDSTATDLHRWYHDGGGDWVYDTNSQIDAANYDTGTGLTGNTANLYYATLFIVVDTALHCIYPTTGYNTVAQAVLAGGPPKPGPLEDFPAVMCVVLKGNASAFPAAGTSQWIDIRPVIGGTGTGSVSDHANLASLNWAAAGHTFDTAVDFNTQNISNIGTVGCGAITISSPTPILVLKDSNSLGAASVGYIEWRDSGGGRAGFLGNNTSTNDDMLWKNEQGGNIGIETTGAGQFEIFANTMLVNGSLTVTSPLLLPDGAVGAPAQAFSSNTDVGCYYTANQINWVINGADRMSLNNTGLSLDRKLGIYTAATTTDYLKIREIDINTASSRTLINATLIKTAGATNYADAYQGIVFALTMNQAAGTIGYLRAVYGSAKLQDGNIGDATHSRDMIAAYLNLNIDAGKIWGNVYGNKIEIDQEAANEITGDIYGNHIWIDADGTVGGLVYMNYLNEGSNVDYGIYQDGTSPNRFGGDLQIAGDDKYLDLGATQNSGLCDTGTYMLFDCDRKSAGSRWFQFDGGPVGIGTSDPEELLQVAGRISVRNTITSRRTRLYIPEVAEDNPRGMVLSHNIKNDNTLDFTTSYGTRMVFVSDGIIRFQNSNTGAGARTITTNMTIHRATNSVGIGASSFQAACRKNLVIKEGTAPGAATADQIYIWAQDDGGTAEAYVQDGAGVQTKFSPHNKDGEWEFYSKNIKTGEIVRINMEKFVQDYDKRFDTSFYQRN